MRAQFHCLSQWSLFSFVCMHACWPNDIVNGCRMIKTEPSNRDSEPWRTYAEALYSGAIDPPVISEILEWHQTQQGSNVKGSRLKLGALSGCGGDVHCGDSLETFTCHGWGTGLLQADEIEPYLLQMYTWSAHAYTRGTTIAPESTVIDRTKGSPSFATPAGVTAPIMLKWALVWEDPIERSLWFGKALPRVWLEEGEDVTVSGASSAYGRVGLSIHSTFRSAKTITANVTVPKSWATSGAPSGGMRLRLRCPDKTSQIKSVTIGGSAWKGFNATEETVVLSKDDLAVSGVLAKMQHVIVQY